MRRGALGTGFGVIVLGLVGLGAVAAYRLLLERRAQLMRELEGTLGASAEAVASVVSERAHSIGHDLRRVCEMVERARRAGENPQPLVHSSLLALHRWTRYDVHLWYLEQGRVVVTVGDTPSSGAPSVSPSELADVDRRARTHPGKMAARQALVPLDSPYDSLRLLALATQDGAASVVVLVNIDKVFDALHSVERLPDIDLWVVDGDGSILVDAESPMEPELLQTLRGPAPTGVATLGVLPSVWPFSSHGLSSSLVAWRSNDDPGFPWKTAVTVSLASVGRSVHELGATVLLIAALVVLVAAGAAGTIVWQFGRGLQLQERLQAHSLLDGLREELIHLEKLSTLGQVAAGLAHEIGTPLGAIAIRIDRLRERAADDDERAALEVMRQEIDRIERMMRQLLDLSRPAARERHPVRVRHAVEQVAGLLAHRFDAQGLGFTVDLDPSLEVVANPDQLQQVFLNLLTNACDACRRGDTIRVRALEAEDVADGARRVGIAVEDSGTGIDAHVRAEVFDPFVTTKPAGQGTGLGLTIVSDILREHGGAVEIAASERGATLVTWWRAPAGAATAASPMGREQDGA